MSTITTRSGKGSPLTHNEVDANFTNLNTDKYQSGDNVTFGTATVTTFTSTGIDDNATSTAITIDASQRVGIGTSDPSSGTSTYYDDLVIKNDTSGTGAGITVQSNTTNGFGAIDFRKADGTQVGKMYASSADGQLGFETGGAERMRIDTSGNVTVGGTTAGNAGTINVSVGSPGSTVGGLQLWAGTSGSHFMQFGDTASGDGYYRGAIGYLHASDALVAYSAGAERMRIDSSGNVGIKTTSPSFPLAGQLHISGGTGYVGLNLQKGSAGTGHLLEFTDENNTLQYRIGTNFASGGQNLLFAYGSTPTIGMTLTSSGNVGIGTTSPIGKLDVSDGTNPLSIDSSTYNEIQSYNRPLLLNRLGNNVGIGTASPSSTLHLYGTGTPIRLNIEATTGRVESRLDNTSGAFIFGIDDSGGAGFGSAYSRNIYSNGAYPMLFWTNNAERMRIDSSGRVGIGTSSPNSNIADGIDCNSTLYGRYDFTSGVPSTGLGMVCTADGNVSGFSSGDLVLQCRPGVNSRSIRFFTGNTSTERMQIDASGNVGIGTTSPSSQLHLYSTDPAIKLQDSAGGDTFGVYTSNTLGFGIYNFTDARQDLTIDGSGNVGIGTTNTNPYSLGITGRSVAIDSSNVSTGSLYALSSGGVARGYLFANASNMVLSSSTALPLLFNTDDTERMRIDSSGKVGIGTSSPTNNLDIGFADLSSGSIGFRSSTYSQIAKIVGSHDSGTAEGSLRFHTRSGGSEPERMRIDSSGRVFIGKTSDNDNTAGHTLHSSGLVVHTRDQSFTTIFNRTTSDGAVVQFRKDGTLVGTIGVASSELYCASGNTGLYFDDVNNLIRPANSTGGLRDNITDLGKSDSRFVDIYATNGTIQTSDANEKQDIEALSEAETRVAVAAKALLRKFRWKSSVEEKGDEARIHFGIIAQDLKAAFEAEGLDAGRYAMFIHSTWTDEETGEERSRMGVRYSELLAFIIAAI